MNEAATADRQQLLHLLGRHWNPPAATMLAAVDRQVEAYTDGTEVIAEDGSRFLDLAGSYGVFLVGHSNPVVREAVATTLTDNPIHVPGTVHPATNRLVTALHTVLPNSLTELSFGSSGAHVVEHALRLAYLAQPERNRIVVVQGGYHGKTLGALTVLPGGHRDPFAPRTPNMLVVPPGGFRCGSRGGRRR